MTTATLEITLESALTDLNRLLFLEMQYRTQAIEAAEQRRTDPEDREEWAVADRFCREMTRYFDNLSRRLQKQIQLQSSEVGREWKEVMPTAG